MKIVIFEFFLKKIIQYDIVSRKCITFVPFNSKYLLFNNEDFICIFLFLLLLEQVRAGLNMCKF